MGLLQDFPTQSNLQNVLEGETLVIFHDGIVCRFMSFMLLPMIRSGWFSNTVKLQERICVDNLKLFLLSGIL